MSEGELKSPIFKTVVLLFFITMTHDFSTALVVAADDLYSLFSPKTPALRPSSTEIYPFRVAHLIGLYLGWCLVETLMDMIVSTVGRR